MYRINGYIYFMPTFNWNEKIQGIPAEWRTTLGEGVRVALIDSGADINHPDLKHLANCRRFDVTKPGFSVDSDNLTADDVVTEHPNAIHGTPCASVLAAVSVDPDGVAGVAPSAEMIIIKATDERGASTNFHFLKALQVAIREGADVISVSYVPTGKFGFQQPLIRAVFDQIIQKNIALCVALDNTDIFLDLNDLRYPASETAALPVGVVTPALLRDQMAGDTFNEAIHWVFPFTEVCYCSENNSRKTEKASSSIANACFSGVVALLIAHLKKTEGTEYQPRTKAELIQLLMPIAAPISQIKAPAPEFRFYTPNLLA